MHAPCKYQHIKPCHAAERGWQWIPLHSAVESMVGISGRSRGCGTCKRRRKGVSLIWYSTWRQAKDSTDVYLMQCDLARPKCRRCIKAGFVCTGYDYDDNVTYSTSSGHQLQYGMHRASNQQVCLPRSFQLSALQSAHFETAWNSMYPSDSPALIKAANRHAWVLDLSQIRIRGTALNFAFAAVALARVGEQRRDPALVHQAAVAYAHALARTRNRLTDPTVALSDESLGCTMLLAMYEVCIPSSPTKDTTPPGSNLT